MTLQDNSSAQSGERQIKGAALVGAEALQQRLSEETANPTHEHQPFDERLHHALEDENLSRALGRFAPNWRE
jgi:L-lactate dehydrogenase complex protein LldF